MAGVQISRAWVGISGSNVRSFNSRGVVAVAGKDREITREDVTRVIDAARGVQIPQDHEVVHVLPREFAVDGQDGVATRSAWSAPARGDVHVVTAPVAVTQNIVTCMNKAGIEVVQLVLEQFAAAEAVLTPDEKELGICLVDIGGGTTEVAVYQKGAIAHTAVIPIGGDHFTNDLAVVLRAPITDAERIKKKYGCALRDAVGEDEMVEVPMVGGRAPKLCPRTTLADILQPRAEELLGLIHEDIQRLGVDKEIRSGVVLTGGGAGARGHRRDRRGHLRRSGAPGRPGGSRRARRRRLASGVGHRDRAPPLWSPLQAGAARGRRAFFQRGRTRSRDSSGISFDGAGKTTTSGGRGGPMIEFVDDDSRKLSIELDGGDASPATIRVIGIGGGGSNAVNRMIPAGVRGVEYFACNTDLQALRKCARAEQAPDRRAADQGARRRRGSRRRPKRRARGSGEARAGRAGRRHGLPRDGTRAGAPARARARSSPSSRPRPGALAVAVVTKPFEFEGKKRMRQAERASRELRDHVDTLITIPNQRLLAFVERNTPLQESFKIADDVLRQAIQGISDLINCPGEINLDFADVRKIMSDMGRALMGTAVGRGREPGDPRGPGRDLLAPARGRLDRGRARRAHQHHGRRAT